MNRAHIERCYLQIAPMKPQAWLIAINEFVGLDFNCDAASIQSGECIAATGEQMLDVFDIPHSGTGTLHS